MSDSVEPKAPWNATYPLARTQTPAAIDQAQLLQRMKDSEKCHQKLLTRRFETRRPRGVYRTHTYIYTS